MDFLKDYDYKILYHPGKRTIVIDALSKKDSVLLAQNDDFKEENA